MTNHARTAAASAATGEATATATASTTAAATASTIATDSATQAARPSLAARPLLLVVRIYQATLRPLLGGHCRFHPTCSDYAAESLARHGALRGSWLTARRLLRCHPFGGAGYDPVPPSRSRGAGCPDSCTREKGL